MLHFTIVKCRIIRRALGIFKSSELLIFNPSTPRENLVSKKRAVITSLKVFENAVRVGSVLDNHLPLRLNYRQNFLAIDFSPFIYSPLQEIRYVYKLFGINQDWVADEGRFSANYTSLNSGSYTFMVKPQSDINGRFVTTFQIIITPPFWQIWWFCSLCIFVAGTIGPNGHRQGNRKKAKFAQSTIRVTRQKYPVWQ